LLLLTPLTPLAPLFSPICGNPLPIITPIYAVLKISTQEGPVPPNRAFCFSPLADIAKRIKKMHFHRILPANSHPFFHEKSLVTYSLKIAYKKYNTQKCKIFVAMIKIFNFCTARSHHSRNKTGRNLSRPRLITALRKPGSLYIPLGCCIFCWCFALRAACICSNCCFC
jgi:hypothetical protein